MQRLVAVACGLGTWLLLAGTSRAQDDECRAVIAKAMKAVGGEEKLAALKASHSKGKGTVTTMGMDIEFTAEVFHQQPDKQKLILDFNIMNMNFTLTQAADGNKGWRNIMDKTTALEDDEMKEMKEGMNAERITNLASLKNKEYKLALLGEVKVGEHQTVGITVSRAGYRDVSLYFDKKTHLLVKSEGRALSPEKEEVNQEKLYSDYKELIPGLKMPSKIVITNDGKKFLEMTITEARTVEKHENSVFAKP